MKTGKIKWFNAEKGFGFITPDAGTEELFLHITAITYGNPKDLQPGDAVEFKIENSAKGLRAASVRLLENHAAQNAHNDPASLTATPRQEG